MKLGTITVDLDELQRQALEYMTWEEDLSYPIRMVLKDMFPDQIGELEDRMMASHKEEVK
jgi:hypothetical protein